MVLLLGLEHLGRSPALVVEASAATDEGDETSAGDKLTVWSRYTSPQHRRGHASRTSLPRWSRAVLVFFLPLQPRTDGC